MVLLFSSTPWPSSNFLPMSGHWIEGYGLRRRMWLLFGGCPSFGACLGKAGSCAAGQHYGQAAGGCSEACQQSRNERIAQSYPCSTVGTLLARCTRGTLGSSDQMPGPQKLGKMARIFCFSG